MNHYLERKLAMTKEDGMAIIMGVAIGLVIAAILL